MGNVFVGPASLKMPSGTVAAPGLPFTVDAASGFYYPVGGYFGIAVNGVVGGLMDVNGNAGYGQLSLAGLTTGISNSGFGTDSLSGVTSGVGNTAIGAQTGGGVGASNNNTIIGFTAGRNGALGGNNTFIGAVAGNINTGAGNVFIGYSAGALNIAGSNTLIISNTNTATPLIGGAFDPAGNYAGAVTFNADSLTVTGLAGGRTVSAKLTGGGLSVNEVVAASPRQGLAVLVAGTVVVNTPAVTANSRIHLTAQEAGILAGNLRVSARTANVSFTITSTNAGDTASVAWTIFEPA
ncbi:MAG TPA: hypothetical protein VIY48_13790 [Candidatus Paceibacterota bacterium]